jgi:conjugal transfer ATP-binding protein TraC
MEQTFIEKAKQKLARAWDEHVLGNSVDMGKDAAPIFTSNEVLSGKPGQYIHRIVESLHGIHNMLQYDVYDAQSGLFYNDQSISFCFEVIPQTGADEDMTARLTTLFTPIPPEFGIQ